MAPHVQDDDWEDESDDDWKDSDEEETMPCPYCGKSIHDESVRCPHCGNYLSEEDQPYRPKSLWIVLTAIACLLAVLMWSCGR